MSPATPPLTAGIHTLALISPGPVLAWLRTRLVWPDRGVGAVLIVPAAKVSLLALR